MPTTLRPILGKSDKFLNLEEKQFFVEYWGNQLSAPPAKEKSRKNKSENDTGR